MENKKVRVAIIGVGNCASSLVQGCLLYTSEGPRAGKDDRVKAEGRPIEPGGGAGIIQALAGVRLDFWEAGSQFRRHDRRLNQAEAPPGSIGERQGDDRRAVGGAGGRFERRRGQDSLQRVWVEGQRTVDLGNDQPFAARGQGGLVRIHP